MKTKTIRVQMDDGTTRWIRVPNDVLTESKRTYANQISTGVFTTDEWITPAGRTIQRRYSCWDNGHSQSEGTYYVEVVDEADRLPTLNYTNGDFMRYASAGHF